MLSRKGYQLAKKFINIIRLSRPATRILCLSLFIMITLEGCLNKSDLLIEATATEKFQSTDDIIVISSPDDIIVITSPVEDEIVKSTPHVSPYVDVIIDDVEIQYLFSDQVLINLLIYGTLPDQCEYDFYSLEKREENTIKITLIGIHPLDDSCSQTNQSFVYELLLGKDLPEWERGVSPGDYELIINDFFTTFSVE